MRAEDVRSFALRAWDEIADAKDEAWLEQRQRGGVRGSFEVADQLARQARASRPDWPSEEERADDLATHVRVAEALRRAAAIVRRR